jgi:hypothetical protein
LQCLVGDDCLDGDGRAVVKLALDILNRQKPDL